MASVSSSPDNSTSPTGSPSMAEFKIMSGPGMHSFSKLFIGSAALSTGVSVSSVGIITTGTSV